MKPRPPILAAMMVLAAFPVAHAQQPPVQVPAVLTLDDARQIARQNSPTYLQTLNDAGPSALGVRQAWAAFLPNLNTTIGSFSGSSSTTTVGEGVFGETVESEERTVKSSSASQGISMGLTLFDGGANFNRLSAARAQVRRTDASIEASAADLDANVTTAFYTARQAAMLVEVELTNLQRQRDRHERNQELFRIAAVDQVSLLESERGVITAQQSLRRQEAEAEKQRLSLAQTLGIDPTIAFDVAPETPDVFDPTTLDADALVARALTASPTARERMAAVQAADQQVGVAKGSRWPAISTSFGWSRGAGETGFGAIGNLNPNDRRGWSFSLSASLPLFTRFQTSASIAQAEASREDAQLGLRQMRLEAERTIRSGLVDLGQTYQAYTDAVLLAELSATQVELAEEQFRLGALDYLRFQTIVDADAQAQRQVVQARFNFVNARIAIERALGAPLNR
jgi:outer membrane protein TolC